MELSADVINALCDRGVLLGTIFVASRGGIVIGRIDILFLLESTVLNLFRFSCAPCSLLVFPSAFFSSAFILFVSRRFFDIGFSGSASTRLHIPCTCPEFYGRAIRFRIYPASRRAISGVLFECARGSTFILEVYPDSGCPELSKR